MNFYYQIYGLQIQSSKKINLLQEELNATSDLSVFWTTDASTTPEVNLKWHEVLNQEINNRKNIFFYKATTLSGTFFKLKFITDGFQLQLIVDTENKIAWLIYDKDELDSHLDTYFVGVILGCILRLLGKVCLHASVININNKAVIFIGQKRSGKSTTAATFAKLGYKVLADDIAVIEKKNGQPYVQSGYAKIRLRPASLNALKTGSEKDYDLVHKNRVSRYTDMTGLFQKEPLPIAAIYLLNEITNQDTLPYIEPILSKGIIYLIENTFAKYVATKELKKIELEILAQLTTTIPIRKFNFTHRIENLTLQCETIIDDFSKLKVNTI